MGFLSGPIAFDCYQLEDSSTKQFGDEEVDTLAQYAIGQLEAASAEETLAGFLAGDHIFDTDFSLEKNVIGDALSCAFRIDTNRVPAALRRAWLQIELAAATANSDSGRPTKAQRTEAKEAVAARCDDELRSGKFRRMQQVPMLWDARENLLYFGGSGGAIWDLCSDILERAFELSMTRLSSGRRAQNWAARAKRRKALESVTPSAFKSGSPAPGIDWWTDEGGNIDFLGNEFLLWLWWHWETQSETLTLPDGSELTGMISRTLTLQCPQGESGKETISAEMPAKLPEALQAIRSGKLPRRAGLTLVRHGDQYELVLQAETFTVSGGRIRVEESAEESAEGQAVLEDRVDALRSFQETLDLLFQAFCVRRIGPDWNADLSAIRKWLKQ